MKKFSFFPALVSISLLLGGCSLSGQKAGLEISSYPQAKVFLDDEDLGTTPFKKTDIKPGELTLRLVPQDPSLTEWSRKLILNRGTTTIVSYEFSAVLDKDSSQLLYFEKSSKKDEASLIITSRPDGASISIDGQMKGITPLPLENLPEQDTQIMLSFPGYQTEEILARPIKSFRLVAEVKLAHDDLPASDLSGQDSASASATTTSEQIEILDTPTGWLRVRSGPATTASETAKIDPGDIFPFLGEENDWYQIELEDGSKGWISGRYAKKITPTPTE